MLRAEALLFDLDGTLIDSEELILSSFRHATAQVLGRTYPDEVMRDMIGIPLDYQMRKLSEEGAAELLRVYREHNRTVHDQLVRAFDGVDKVMAALKQRGYRCAVVTSKLTYQAVHGLEMFDLVRYFEFVQGSDQTERHKPDPTPLLVAAEKMGIAPSQCVYVGDSPYDMQAARAAGMTAVAALWGMFSRERLLEGGAQHEAASAWSLLDLFA
ncbi:MAG: HAD-IA family hydrolase [Coriobacteriales bacterium]|jgi:pyrophosphatase PpaX|nr:HAD-IA family hydrolase [Coriobacteriales bacterium]